MFLDQRMGIFTIHKQVMYVVLKHNSVDAVWCARSSASPNPVSMAMLWINQRSAFNKFANIKSDKQGLWVKKNTQKT